MNHGTFRILAICSGVLLAYISMTSVTRAADCVFGDDNSIGGWAGGMGTALVSCPDLRKEIQDKMQRMRKALAAAIGDTDRDVCLRAFDGEFKKGQQREKDPDHCASVRAQRASVEQTIVRLNEEAARRAGEKKGGK